MIFSIQLSIIFKFQVSPIDFFFIKCHEKSWSGWEQLVGTIRNSELRFAKEQTASYT